MAEMRNAEEIFVRKAEGKRLLGRPRCRWEDNIRKDLYSSRLRSCGLAQDRNQRQALVNT